MSTPVAAFHERVDTSNGPNACWPFTGRLDKDGYGELRVRAGEGRQRAFRAHRLAWELANDATVPTGKMVLHNCHNPTCCNPAHLRIGTHRDNMQDKAMAGSVKGGRNPRARLNDAIVLSMRQALSSPTPPTLNDLAQQYGVSVQLVDAAVRGKSWPHVGGPLYTGKP